jgi:hypothetical protein
VLGDSTSGVRERDVLEFNLAFLNSPELTDAQRESIVARFRTQDAVVLLSEDARAAAEGLAEFDLPVYDLTHPIVPEHSAAIASNVELGPRTVRSVYTGVIPLVFKTQRQLLVSLGKSISWATLLIAGVMAIVFRNAIAGMIAMLPNVFPILLVFGALGWCGKKIDIGIMMTASVALGVAVDNTVHLVTWFRDALRRGMNRRDAMLSAYDRCATAMAQTALVGGVGLVVFAFSAFTPTQQFGYMMITILCAALIGDLVMLPALLCSPLGKFFECGPTNPPAGFSGQHEPTAPAASESNTSESFAVETAGERESATTGDSRRNGEPLASPTNAALHAKLRSFRRPAEKDARGSR